ncbi:HipA family kinase [Clostridium neonatale]|uniref:HipA-like kinase domain-containing protein n=1 Tax=Clostridium neonatale TaxID=137838 RepID=A0AAD2DDI3_9CLOT|nr:HipA family kinase [Clostridium neonatale]CAI3193605.1 conserved hypothetical protein [Clostridium neonatale]CAI3195108.1 conserved hypothetical protein [Clostridium neonatale]CAI3200184.1 conserved hypothetical protein [Clostridium neonatale]CAI3222692.1 conserved hypothetical protein [Clostridium neonatale]CAI3244825.1 conserved hypothetical protein [Clostridium neonatale]
MREIEVETFLKPMGDGVTRPAEVIGDDQKEYILKNQKVYQNGKFVEYDCMFLNEMLAFQIGKYLGVPMPEAVVAKIYEETIESDPEIRFAYRFEKGTYFATEELKQIENNLMNNYKELVRMGKPYVIKSWNKFFKDVNNKNDIASIIAFDILIANFDRYNNEGNILISNTNTRKIYAIDHGHSFFSPIWNDVKINNLSISKITDAYIQNFALSIMKIMKQAGVCSSGIIFNALEQHIDLEDVNNHSFVDIVSKIKSINQSMILEWCNNVPDCWYINKEYQINCYMNFIMRQKEAVQYIIQILANNRAFTNYRGGILQYGTSKKENNI